MLKFEHLKNNVGLPLVSPFRFINTPLVAGDFPDFSIHLVYPVLCSLGLNPIYITDPNQFVSAPPHPIHLP